MWHRPAFICQLFYWLLLATGVAITLFGVLVMPKEPERLSVLFKTRDGQWQDIGSRDDVMYAMEVTSRRARDVLVAAGAVTIVLSAAGLSAARQNAAEQTAKAAEST